MGRAQQRADTCNPDSRGWVDYKQSKRSERVRTWSWVLYHDRPEPVYKKLKTGDLHMK